MSNQSIKPIKSEEMANPRISNGTGWSFNYEGPVNKIDNRNCVMCNAVASKECGKTEIQHGTNGKTNCSSCQAARHGHCHNHCGILVALEEYTNTHELNEKEKVSFEIYKKTVQQYLSSMPDGKYRIELKASVDQERKDWPLFAQIKIQIDVIKQ